MRRIVLNPTGKTSVAFKGSQLATFRIKVGCSRFVITVYASRNPSNGLYYVRKEVNPYEQNVDVIFFGSLADAYSHLKKDWLSLESASNVLGKRGEPRESGTCKRKEAIL